MGVLCGCTDNAIDKAIDVMVGYDQEPCSLTNETTTSFESKFDDEWGYIKYVAGVGTDRGIPAILVTLTGSALACKGTTATVSCQVQLREKDASYLEDVEVDFQISAKNCAVLDQFFPVRETEDPLFGTRRLSGITVYTDNFGFTVPPLCDSEKMYGQVKGKVVVKLLYQPENIVQLSTEEIISNVVKSIEVVILRTH